MSTKYIASNWRLPNQENSSKNDNYGLDFDGSNEFINIGITPNSLVGSNNAYTVSAWVNPDISGNLNIIGAMDTSNRWYFRVLNGYASYAYGTATGDNGYNTEAATEVSLNVWSNIVFTFDGSTTHKIYINGDLKLTQSSGSGQTVTSTRNLYIGALNNNGSTQNYMNGSISELAVFDYALSSTQISTLYGSSLLGAGNPMAIKPQPVGYWPLGDNSASNPLTQPNEAVADASVFDFVSSSSQFIHAGSASYLNGLSEFTLSCWFKLDTAANNNTIISDWNYNSDPFGHFGLETKNASGSTFGLRLFIKQASDAGSNNVETGGGVFTANVWYNVIFTYNAGTVTCYKNGTSVSLTTIGTIPTTLTNQDGNLNIGKFGGTLTRYFNGEISNIAIWNSDQSSEISNIYNSGVPATTYTNTPTAWYKLDQSANWDVSSSGNWTIPDASSNGNDGTSSGMTSANLVLSDLTRAVPYDSYSFNFDGTNYITTGTTLTNLSVSTSFSISCWVNITSNVNYYHIVGAPSSYAAWDTGFGLFTNGSGIRFWVEQWNGSNQFVETSSLSNGQWYHIAATFDTTNGLKLYVNAGTPTTATGTTIDGLSNTIFIGSTGTNTTYGFNGKISNVSIFNQELTSTEVMKLYSNGVPQDLSSFSPAPEAWWTLGSNSFFNGSNYICRDLIGSNDGTSANAGVDAVVGDSPRSEANGTGTNIDVPSNLEGSTKYSSNNSWSINMSETARVEDTP